MTCFHSLLYFQWLVAIVNVLFDILIPKVKSRIARGTIVGFVDMVNTLYVFFRRRFNDISNVDVIRIISGPFCKHRHRRRVLCPNYLAGFCPDGRDCKYAHPSFNIPPVDTTQMLRARGQYNIGIVCHNCHERGHKVLIKHDSQIQSLIHASFQFD